MLVTVRQLPKEQFRDMMCIYNEKERFAFAMDQLKHNNYIRVADIDIQKGENPYETAFTLTQNLNNAWYLNPRIEVANDFKGGCRSTSVGDIIQIRGASFMVDSFGFTELRKDS
jgi:hypothetical protein